MSESLPLIPEKGGAVCADVRPVLRDVFRECDYLPPLAPRRPARAHAAGAGSGACLPALDQWVEKYDSDYKDIWQREGELKQQYAKRISRDPLPNIYKLHPPTTGPSYLTSWMKEQGIIQRKDLIPSVIQNSDVEETLWVRNILNGSSGNLSRVLVQGTRVVSPVPLRSPRELSLQSVSIGELRTDVRVTPAPRLPPPPTPDHILCVPPHLDFVNFTVGQLHSQGLRLVNVSKFEVRLSVRPPSSKELDIELCGSRGLIVTSGAAAEFKINFRPRDVRVLRDVLQVRVSTGKLFHIPISCYMQPPFLDILVPAVSSSIFLCTPGQAAGALTRSADCLELGARLLGDVHCVPVMFHCEADHAAFFLLTEDAWLSFTLDVVTSRGSLVAAPFVVWPAWWQGGGAVRGCVFCHADVAGLHAVALRVLATTAVVRPLHLIADALYFRPEHVTLEAQEKDYDICSDDDPACEYYVHLGTAFPHRALSATVQLINHSPVVYSYYWSVRPWGACSCWAERESDTLSVVEEGSDNLSDGLCVGATEARDNELRDGPPEGSPSSSASCLRVEPARGALAPRSSCGVHVCAPDVGTALGVQRAVLMLVLKGIPKESLPDNYDPMFVKTDVVESDPVPGMKRWTREICEIVCTQMEVWWVVAPVRFVLDPPSLHLEYSRRVSALEVTVRATQLFGSEGVRCDWRAPAHVAVPPPLALTPASSCTARLAYCLPTLPNHFPETDLITLEAAQAEWEASSAVTRRCATRHPALLPARRWLGVVPPGAAMHAALHVYNDTYQHICWWVTPFRWYRENPPSQACGSASARAGEAREPCLRCQQHTCTCAIVRPTRGALRLREGQDIQYAVHAPETDGCVATLIKVQRTSADVAHVAGGAGSDARAGLVAYRVLAPRLVLRVLPCHGDKRAACEGCALDEGADGSARGTATLRPRSALPLGQRSCYRLQFTNTTPLPTTVTWDPPLEEDVLKVIFCSEQFDVGSYARVEIQVVVEARRVCGRRLHLRRARVRHAHQPLYLVIDAAVSGVEVVYEVPLGGDEKTDTTVVMKRTQAEVYPWEAEKVSPQTFEEIFAEEDKKRAERAENLCSCKSWLQYIPPPPPRPRPPPKDDGDYPPIEIVWEPPPLTRVCACHPVARPQLPRVPEPYCLQFRRLPLRTVRTRTVVVRNESVLAAAWSAAVRSWPRVHVRRLDHDQWAGDVRAPGVCVQVTPRAGVLAPRAHLLLSVAVYADCWGLYREQLAIQVENVEPLVLDVWVQAEGPPLQFALALADPRAPVLCWTSRADPARTLLVKNVSRAELTVHAYLLREHASGQSEAERSLWLWMLAAREQDGKPPGDQPTNANAHVCVPIEDERRSGATRTCCGDYTAIQVSSLHYRYDGERVLSQLACHELPFRLYLRLFDVEPAACPCLYSDGEEEAPPPSESSCAREMDTGVELYLAPDLGVQTDQHYTVTPETRNMSPGEWLTWSVQLLALSHAEVAPPSVLLLRALPLNNTGAGWARPAPAPQAVRLRQAAREPRLRLSCRELRVRVCAIRLPPGDVLRVRKRFHVQNVGGGPLEADVRTERPWALVLEEQHVGCACGAASRGSGGAARERGAPLHLMPRSSLEMCVEVAISTAEVCPTLPEPLPPPAPPVTPLHMAPPAAYAARRECTTLLYFYDQDNILKTLPLVLELEFPVLTLEPPLIDFGFVTDGDSRKSYFSITHSSRSAVLELRTEWVGGEGFCLHPHSLTLRPGERERIYIQYTAKWCGAPVEGRCVARVASGAGAWCRAAAGARASPARDLARHVGPRDHTDDTRLAPSAPPAALCL